MADGWVSAQVSVATAVIAWGCSHPEHRSQSDNGNSRVSACLAGVSDSRVSYRGPGSPATLQRRSLSIAVFVAVGHRRSCTVYPALPGLVRVLRASSLIDPNSRNYGGCGRHR